MPSIIKVTEGIAERLTLVPRPTFLFGVKGEMWLLSLERNLSGCWRVSGWKQGGASRRHRRPRRLDSGAPGSICFPWKEALTWCPVNEVAEENGKAWSYSK